MILDYSTFRTSNFVLLYTDFFNNSSTFFELVMATVTLFRSISVKMTSVAQLPETIGRPGLLGLQILDLR